MPAIKKEKALSPKKNRESSCPEKKEIWAEDRGGIVCYVDSDGRTYAAEKVLRESKKE